VTSTRVMRQLWADKRCDYGTWTNMFGRTPIYAQETTWIRALEQAHYGAGYIPTPGGFIGSKRNCPRGIGGKPCQSSGSDCSLHNYGLAWDVEYNYNPHFKRRLTEQALWELYDEGKTKYNPDIVAIILLVKTTKGNQAFHWLGYSIGDTMHWQWNTGPDDREIDWTTVPNTNEEGMLRNGSSGINVAKWQNYLNRWDSEHANTFQPLVEDGEFGDKTEQMTRAFQTWTHIEETGMVGYMDTGTMAISIKKWSDT